MGSSGPIIIFLRYIENSSGNKIDQLCSSPANSPNPLLDGLGQGLASKAFANSDAAGEKYAMASQCSLPSDSRRLNTAAAGERSVIARNRLRISSAGSSAIMPSPRESVCHISVMWRL